MKTRSLHPIKKLSFSAALLMLVTLLMPVAARADGECRSAIGVPALNGVTLLCRTSPNEAFPLDVAQGISGRFALVGPSSAGQDDFLSVWISSATASTTYPVRTRNPGAAGEQFPVVEGQPKVAISAADVVYVARPGYPLIHAYSAEDGVLIRDIDLPAGFNSRSLYQSQLGQAWAIGMAEIYREDRYAAYKLSDSARYIYRFSDRVDPDHSMASVIRNVNSTSQERFYTLRFVNGHDELFVDINGAPFKISTFSRLAYYPVRLVQPKGSGEVYLIAANENLPDWYRVYKVSDTTLTTFIDIYGDLPRGAVESLDDGLLIQPGTGDSSFEPLIFVNEDGTRKQVLQMDPTEEIFPATLLTGPKHLSVTGNGVVAGFTYRDGQNQTRFALGQLSADRSKFEMISSSQFGSVSGSEAMMSLGSSGTGLFVSSATRGLMFADEPAVYSAPKPVTIASPSFALRNFVAGSTITLTGENLAAIRMLNSNVCYVDRPAETCSISYSLSTGKEQIRYQLSPRSGNSQIVAETEVQGRVVLGLLHSYDPYAPTPESTTLAAGSIGTLTSSTSPVVFGVSIKPIGGAAGSSQILEYDKTRSEVTYKIPANLAPGQYELTALLNLYQGDVREPDYKLRLTITEPVEFGPVTVTAPPAAQAGQSFTVEGADLGRVEKILVGGEEATISRRTEFKITATLPNNNFGPQLVTLYVDSSQLDTGKFVHYINPAANPAFGTWTTRISETQAKMYAKNPFGVGKVQFKLNGREVAWVRPIDATDPKLTIQLQGPMAGVAYLVRTVNLRPGKNVLEIFVGDVRERRVVYGRR